MSAQVLEFLESLRDDAARRIGSDAIHFSLIPADILRGITCQAVEGVDGIEMVYVRTSLMSGVTLYYPVKRYHYIRVIKLAPTTKTNTTKTSTTMPIDKSNSENSLEYEGPFEDNPKDPAGRSRSSILSELDAVRRRNTDKVLASLQDAYERDPVALQTLLGIKVDANQALRQREDLTCEEGTIEVLGLINGILHAIGGQPIAARYMDEDSGRLIGFMLYADTQPAKPA